MQSSFLHGSPHLISSLPCHPSLNNPPSSPPLHDFLHSALTEAQAFLTSIPHSFHFQPKIRTSAPASSPVQVATRPIPPTGDFWVCRRSVHENAAVQGSASWEEFRSGLRQNHAENEMSYTPSVTAVERLLEWPTVTEIEGGWKQVTMHVTMITHTFHPTFLIAPRSFVVLAIEADLPEPSSHGFVIVQVSLDTHSKGSIPAALSRRIAASAPRNAIFASYASVEQVIALLDGIEWTMATASDAGGAIPQWIQRSWTMGGVPKAIVSDVGLFIGWIAARRKAQPRD